MTNLELEKQLKILSAIARIHHNIGANLELDQIGQILVKELTEIVPCDGCAILVIDGNEVQILAEKGFLKMLGDTKFSTDMPAIKQIIETKKSIYSGDIMNGPEASCVPAECMMNSLICSPIIVEGEVKGIIHLDSKNKNAFNVEDLHFTELMTKEAAIALTRSILYSKVKALSAKDSLTGCLNRGKFDEDLKSALACAKRYERAMSLLMIDIDWFKLYNDSHGHHKGDILLKKMASILQCGIRLCDKVYRYGGEEFALILPETGKKQALIAAERLKATIEQERFEGEEISQPYKKLSISIGIAGYPEDADSEIGLIEAADAALYRAKQTGKNAIFVK